MNERRRHFMIQADGGVITNFVLTVQVDPQGEEWLTPDQIEALESARSWVRFWASDRLKRRTKRLVMVSEQAPPEGLETFFSPDLPHLRQYAVSGMIGVR
mgnify:CR=1 FL=1